MIVPTIGRVIHVYRNEAGTPPEPALITYVHNDRKINVGGFSYTGDAFALRDVILLQDDDTPPSGAYAAWMPYQINKAASAVDSALAGAVAQAESTAAVPAAVAPKVRSKPAPTSDNPDEVKPVDPAA